MASKNLMSDKTNNQALGASTALVNIINMNIPTYLAMSKILGKNKAKEGSTIQHMIIFGHRSEAQYQ